MWPFDGIRRHGPLTASAVMALRRHPPTWPFDDVSGCFVAKAGNQKNPNRLYNLGGLVFA
jgi:hypothetical protein